MCNLYVYVLSLAHISYRMDTAESKTKESEEGLEKKNSTDKENEEESKDVCDMAESDIVTREDKKKAKPSAAKKRGMYKKALKRSSATDDIDMISKDKDEQLTGC